MYPAIKSYAIEEAEARDLVGDEAVDKVLEINCEATSRVIDDCFGVVEFSASLGCVDLQGNDVTLEVLYLEDTAKVSATDDLGSLDWDNFTFTVE